VEIEDILSSKEVEGYHLIDFMYGDEDAAEPDNPVRDRDAWVNAEQNRTREQHRELLSAWRKWDRANRAAHGCIMAALPEELKAAAAQHLKTEDFWRYLTARFADNTLTSKAALWARLFSLRLSDYSGVSDYLVGVNNIKSALKESGAQVDPSAVAGVILIGMGDSFQLPREVMLNLPAAEKTEDIFAFRLLEAEKNARVQTELNTLSVGSGTAAAAAATPSKYPVCTYKYAGRNNKQAAGTLSGSPHVNV